MSASAAAARAEVDRAVHHWSRGDLGAALACCRRALALDPANVDALAHTGTLAWLGGDVDEAERLYHAAHARAPAHVGVLVNLATLANERGDVERSLAWLDAAEAVRPGHPDVVWRKGLAELAMGRYADGWAHYEAGLRQPSMRGAGPGFATPGWDGRPCDRLLLWHEQGYGDTIQFVRYARLCRERARRIVVLCPPPLIALLRSCPSVDDAVETIDADAFDAQIAMMSLPHRFGTTLETVPADVPYLFADATRAARFASRMPAAPLRVGLAWAGNVRRDAPRFHAIDRARSMAYGDLAPLTALPGIAFYSLQKGDAAAQARGTGIVDLMDEVDDFADTAALVANLDLVVTVDTSVAHLAGALGKPVWVLSRRDACWRWLRNRVDSPWYPTARVYGQTARHDWKPVVETVRDDLRTFAADHGRARRP